MISSFVLKNNNVTENNNNQVNLGNNEDVAGERHLTWADVVRKGSTTEHNKTQKQCEEKKEHS